MSQNGITFGSGINLGAGVQAGSGFTLTSADFTNANFGYGCEGDNTGFSVGGLHGAGEAYYGPILSANSGGSASKSAEILAFFNNNGLTVNNNSYLFDVTWASGSSTNTTRNVVVLSFYYNNADSTGIEMGVVDTNVAGWDTPGQNPFAIAAANGTFLLPATFKLIRPTVQDISSWC